MINYEAHIICKCDENAFIDSFRFLSTIFHKDYALEFDPNQEHTFRFYMLEELDRRLQGNRLRRENGSSAMNRFIHFKENDLAQTRILFTIEIQNDADLDVFSYRYFFLITNQLLRKQDQVHFDCPDIYYHKTGSYFFLQTLSQRQGVLFKHYSEGKIKSLPQSFSLSSEWFPAIYLSNQNSEIYEILANPIFKDIKDLQSTLRFNKEDSGRLDFTKDVGLCSRPLKEQYVLSLKQYFANWLNGMLAKIEIAERLYSVSGIAQLLFAILCKNFWGKTSRLDKGKVERLLDICCDFGDCILQVAENIVSHTEGGVLSIRVNSNWNKIEKVFKAKETEKGKRWYLRISLVDVSKRSILDNIKQKSGIDTLTLSHIFMEQEAPKGMLPEQYQDIAQAYGRYLNDSEQIIHHYGLAVFRNVVNQYSGCFTVKSDAENTSGSVAQYALNSDKIIHVAPKDALHIPGSEYDILLPLDKDLLEEINQWSNPSLLLRPKYIVPSVSRKIKFQKEIFDHFNQPLSDMIRKVSRAKNLQHQQLKEYVVKTSAQALAKKLIAEDPKEITNSIFYFFLSDVTEQVFGRTEIVAKIIMQTISELKKQCPQEDCEKEWLYIVFYGLSEGRLAQFTRQFALFYHRNQGNRLMKGCRLYVVSKDYRAEVMFAGVKLSIISDYSRSRRLVTGTPARISNILEHISSRDEMGRDAGDYEEIEAFPFELLARMEQIETADGKKEVICSPHNKWYHRNLETVLYNDIHGGDLGCRLEGVHVGVENIHLHTFFEGQLLFANTYWYHIFAHYICEMVLADSKITERKDILLYGYETYSEQMLFSAAEKLREKGRRVQYAIFENPKYITSAETSEQRVRYIDRFLSSCKNDICIVYVLGIGTTLATINKHMHTELERSFRSLGKSDLLKQAYKKGLVIVQVSGGEQDDKIACDRINYTVSSKMAELGFLSEKVCHCLVEAQTEWYPVRECPYCLRAKSYCDELPLIQTNETSTVPMILIKPLKRSAVKMRFKQEKTYSRAFLENSSSAEYIYYKHLNRGGNHYQFYIRTAALLNDYRKREDRNLNAWFREIKAKEVGNEGACSRKNRINVIVSPLHFSNESLIAAVNDRVFDGEAYIINFDVKKEFRDSFVAKFQNYHSALGMLCRDSSKSEHDTLELNFYFVDDIILTGATFNRAKSLISSMLGEFLRGDKGESGITINLFKGIILLVNRNSKETLCNYLMPNTFEKDAEGYLLLPVYCFIELNTPAIRSYGDSCPICNKVERIKRLEKESSLTYVERHWREKAEYHGLKKLSDAKYDKAAKDQAHKEDKFYKTRGLRRLQCSEIIWALLKENKLTIKNAEDVLAQEINAYLKRLATPEEQIEYLISFLKIISREHVVYQEAVQPAALKMLLAIFSVFVEDGAAPQKAFYNTVEELIHNQTIQRHAYALYQLVIARLCAMGSTVFCRREQLESCLETGLRIEKNVMMTGSVKEGTFSEFLCIQIKKMLFMTQDYAFRVEELQCVLSAWIKDELGKDGEDKDGKA